MGLWCVGWWAAERFVPSSFNQWQRCRRDKGVAEGVSSPGGEEGSSGMLIPWDKRQQTSGLGWGLLLASNSVLLLPF